MEYYTVAEVQEILKLGRKNAYALVNQPDFPKLRIGRSIRIPKQEFEQFMAHLLYNDEYRI